MSKIFVPPSLLEELVCLTCKRLLSVYPIYTNVEGLGGICGRCNGSKEGFIRDEAFECLVKQLLFPCTYKCNGCTEVLQPELLKVHEEECSFDRFQCFNHNCQWKGAKENLPQHYEKEHTDLVLKEPQFNLNITKPIKRAMLLKHNAETLQFNAEFDPKRKLFYYLIKPIKSNALKYSYDVKFEFNEQFYTGKEYVMSEDDVKMKEEDLNNCFADSEDIIVHIRIKQPLDNDAENAGADTKENPNIDWKMLNELECPVCFEYMLPPIFQCVIGHSVCEMCKPKLFNCPTCKSKLEKTRNFILEKMTQKLNYPCKYFKQGCSFYALSGDIRNHENSCDYGPIQCPLKYLLGCKWFGNESDFAFHIEEKHVDNLLKDGIVDVPFQVQNNCEHIFFIKFSKRVFMLLYKYETNDKSSHWNVHLLGSKHKTNKFRFEIEIVDLSGRQMSLIWRGPVKRSADTNCAGKVFLNYSQIENFIKDRIVFRVRIFKD